MERQRERSLEDERPRSGAFVAGSLRRFDVFDDRDSRGGTERSRWRRRGYASRRTGGRVRGERAASVCCNVFKPEGRQGGLGAGGDKGDSS